MAKKIIFNLFYFPFKKFRWSAVGNIRQNFKFLLPLEERSKATSDKTSVPITIRAA